MPDPLDQEQLRKLLESAPSDIHLQIIQAYLRTVDDPRQKKFVETLLLTSRELGREFEKKRLVVLLHGIRSTAIWQERIRSRLKIEAPNLEVIPMGYGRYPLLKFLGLRGTRDEPINRIRNQLRYLTKNNPDAEISVLAHSFGTYIMSEILKADDEIRINRLLVCGSIIRENYEWENPISHGRITGAITNDFGTRDYWPLIASKLPLGYGASGFYGFRHVAVKDNCHNCGHSDFFTDEHLVKYWIPFLLDGHVVFSDWNMNRDDYANYGRFKLFVTFFIFIAVMAFFWWLLN